MFMPPLSTYNTVCLSLSSLTRSTTYLRPFLSRKMDRQVQQTVLTHSMTYARPDGLGPPCNHVAHTSVPFTHVAAFSGLCHH